MDGKPVVVKTSPLHILWSRELGVETRTLNFLLFLLALGSESSSFSFSSG